MDSTETFNHRSTDPSLTTHKALVLDHISNVKLESAQAAMNEFQVSLEKSDFDPIIDSLTAKVDSGRTEGEVRSANQFTRRIRAIKSFRDHGLDSKKLISPVILPEGYKGKILLVNIFGGMIREAVCLRSGDLWHREILRNTEEEMKDSGFENAIVDPLGGAWVRFDDKCLIEIYGRSEEFGECDKQAAAELIGRAYPGRKIFMDT